MQTANEELTRLATDGVKCALVAIDDDRLSVLPRDLLVRFVTQAAFVSNFARHVSEMKQARSHGSIAIMR